RRVVVQAFLQRAPVQVVRGGRVGGALVAVQPVDDGVGEHVGAVAGFHVATAAVAVGIGDAPRVALGVGVGVVEQHVQASGVEFLRTRYGLAVDGRQQEE